MSQARKSKFKKGWHLRITGNYIASHNMLVICVFKNDKFLASFEREGIPTKHEADLVFNDLAEEIRETFECPEEQCQTIC